MSKKLSPKEKAFCRAYINLREGKAAAIKAGYSAKTADVKASQLLRKVSIRDEVSRLEDKLEEKSIITRERIENELALVAFCDMADYVTIGQEGQVTLKTFEEMPNGASRAVKSVEEIRRIMGAGKGDGEEVTLEVRTRYSHHSKIDALKELSKLKGFYPEEGTGEAKHIVYIFGSEGK